MNLHFLKIILSWFISLLTFNIILLYESIFSIVNFIESYDSASISNENLVIELVYAISIKYKLDFEDSIQKE